MEKYHLAHVCVKNYYYGLTAEYASVRHFLYFDHVHIVDLFYTSTRLLRPFVISGLLIIREVHLEVKFGEKSQAKV